MKAVKAVRINNVSFNETLSGPAFSDHPEWVKTALSLGILSSVVHSDQSISWIVGGNIGYPGDYVVYEDGYGGVSIRYKEDFEV